MSIISLGIGWLAGIWLAASMDWPWWAWLALGSVNLLGAVGARRRPRARLVLLAAAGLGLGGLRYATAVPTLSPTHVASHVDSGDFVTLSGLIVDEPDVRDRSVNLRLRPDELTLPDGTAVSVHGDVLLRTARFPVIPYGARVRVRGLLETPPEFDTFSYKEYLARQGIHAMMSQPRLDVLAFGQGHPLKQAIFAVKGRAQAAIQQRIPDPEAALLTGILLGDDNGLPPALADDFRITGMTHIIAISGFNIAILIGIMAGLGEPLFGRRGAAVAALVGVAFYTILVGADASVVRAALMGGLHLFASRWLGRPTFAYASLLLAAVVMTLANPHTLWDVGFQLSFTATLGLMLYADPFAQAMRRWLARRFARPMVNRLMGLLNEALLVTLAAQVLTLPLMVAYFGQVSLISLPANFLILPLQPGVMLWGGVATLAGLLLPALAQPLAWVAWLFLRLTILLVELFAGVPGAAVSVSLSPAGLVLLYAGIAAVTWYGKQPAERRAALRAALRPNLSRR
ncbi:MAG: ComEC/Rec2 family competence protein, partial [Anaerolineales bacterium]|nr:ComEC/Rec2 family competence protein [Anaerolineales bacterium]